MSIPVHCPECQFRFHVGDEYAGRPGRCPECAAVLNVPDAAPERRIEHDEPDPYRNRRTEDAYGEPNDDEVRPSRRLRDYDRRDQRREDYEDRPGERKFDPKARAEKWEAVGRGFRNLMIAFVLMTLDEVIGAGFQIITFAQQVGQAPQALNVIPPAEQALLVANSTFTAIASIFWAIGRLGCGRTPFVPARGMALTAGIMAGFTAAALTVAMSGVVIGVLVVPNNLNAGMGLIMMGFCTAGLGMIGFVVSEILALVAQIRIAGALRDDGFGRASKLLMAATIGLIVLGTIAFCGFVVWAMAEAGRQQQQANGMGPQGAPKAQPIPPVGQPGPPPGQPPPPEFDPADHPELMVAIGVGRIAIALIYGLLAVICFHLGRKAVRNEVTRLVGETEDHDPWRH